MVKSVSCCCLRGSRLFSDLVTIMFPKDMRFYPHMHSLCLNHCLLYKVWPLLQATLMITDYKTIAIGFYLEEIEKLHHWTSFNTCFASLYVQNKFLRNTQINFIQYITQLLFSKFVFVRNVQRQSKASPIFMCKDIFLQFYVWKKATLL